MVPCVGLQRVIVVFPDHNHLLFVLNFTWCVCVCVCVCVRVCVYVSGSILCLFFVAPCVGLQRVVMPFSGQTH